MLPGRPRISKVLAELSPIYKIDERWLYPRARRNEILGITRQDGSWLCQGIPGFQGPVPAKSTAYLLPAGTRSLSWEYLPGSVTGLVFVGAWRETPKKTLVELHSQSSGRLISLVTDPPVTAPQALASLVFEFR